MQVRIVLTTGINISPQLNIWSADGLTLYDGPVDTWKFGNPGQDNPGYIATIPDGVTDILIREVGGVCDAELPLTIVECTTTTTSTTVPPTTTTTTTCLDCTTTTTTSTTSEPTTTTTSTTIPGTTTTTTTVAPGTTTTTTTGEIFDYNAEKYECNTCTLISADVDIHTENVVTIGKYYCSSLDGFVYYIVAVTGTNENNVGTLVNQSESCEFVECCGTTTTTTTVEPTTTTTTTTVQPTTTTTTTSE